MFEQELVAKHIMYWIKKGWMPPMKLDILPTDLCNLNCKFCWQRDPNFNNRLDSKSYELSDERLLELVEEGAEFGVKRWEFSGGGEPLMRKDILLKMIGKIKSDSNMWVSIITNGTLLDSSTIEELVDLECDQLIISLDGPNKEINDKLRPPEGTFSKVMETLTKIEKCKREKNILLPVVKIHCVISKINLDYIPDMVKIASKYNLRGITFDLLQDLSAECKKFSINLEKEYKILEPKVREACVLAFREDLENNLLGFLPRDRGKDIKKSDYSGNSFEYDNKVDMVNVRCFEPWYRMYIHVGGDVSPCCAVPIFKDDNVKDKSLKEIWEGENYSEFRKRIFTGNLSDACRKCGVAFAVHSNIVRAELKKLLYKEEMSTKKNKYYIQLPRKYKKINLCLVSREYPPETDWGGIGTYTYQLAHGLVNLGNRVHVISQSLDFDKEYEDDGVYVHRIAHPNIFVYKKRFEEFCRRIEYSWKVYQKIVQIHRKEKLDMIEGPNFSAECLIYSFFKKTPLVTRIHTPFSEVIENFKWEKTMDRKISCWLEDILLYRSDLIITSTSIYAKLYNRRYYLSKKFFSVIPLGINLNGIKTLSDDLKNSQNPLILFVGRLEKRKGVHILMDAIPEVLKVIPNANFVIIGRDSFFQQDEISFTSPDGKNFKDVFWKKLSPKFRSQVKILGYVDRYTLNQFYKRCDLFVAPSLHETFGFVYLEAMSYGKPVVGCSVGGVPEVVKNGRVGLLVPPENSDKLAEAIIKLCSDFNLRKKMGQEAFKYVRGNYTVEKLIENTLENYEKVINLYK